MIYCVEPEMYPSKDLVTEEISYLDENGFEWKIARIDNGFFVKYFGDSYFKDDTFECETKYGEYVRVKNTNCIFIQNTSFETFVEVRDLIKEGWTDDIWDTFREMFEERFDWCKDLLESEVVN